MHDGSFTAALQGSVAAKLRLARQATGLSTRAVAEKLAGRFPISHASIANYEKGASQPTLALLATLAELYERPLNWFLERGPALTGVRYRNQPSKLRAGDKHRYEAEALRWLEAYIQIEKFLGERLEPKYPLPAIPTDLKPKQFAESMRKLVGLAPDAPIPSVIDLLEAFGIRVIELPTDLRIDGFAAMMGDEPVVVLNSNRPADRMRLNALHEWKHVLLGHCDNGESPVESGDSDHEDIAFACARHFALPKAKLQEAFDGKSFVKLVKLKEEHGFSLAAIIYAARQENVLSEKWAKHLWIELSRRGWRVKEPGHVRPDRAVRFEHLVDKAMYTGRLTAAQVARIIGVREEELLSRVRVATGIASDEPQDGASEKEGGGEPFMGMRLAK